MARHEQRTNPRTSGRLKIGEVAKRSGVAIETLRFYERSGLIRRPPRTEAGYRMFDESVFERLEFIRQAQHLGFTLAEIARITAESDAGQSPCAEVRAIVRVRLAELDQRLAELKRYRQQLADTLAEWDEVGEAEGHVCGLIERSTIDSTPATTTARIGARRRTSR